MDLAMKLIKRKPSLKLPTSDTKEKTRCSCSLLVIGHEGVGKTALIVRFLAKRFLPQYDGDSDKTYIRAVQIEEKLLKLTVEDKCGKNVLGRINETTGLESIDGVIVVFSLEERDSFDTCLHLLDFFKFDCQHTIKLPILVIGNKNDLTHLREIGNKEAEKCVLKYPDCSYEECSAAATEDQTVEIIFRSFIKKANTVRDNTHELKKNGRKVSVTALGSPKVTRAHFKQRFNMVGRDRSGSQ